MSSSISLRSFSDITKTRVAVAAVVALGIVGLSAQNGPLFGNICIHADAHLGVDADVKVPPPDKLHHDNEVMMGDNEGGGGKAAGLHRGFEMANTWRKWDDTDDHDSVEAHGDDDRPGRRHRRHSRRHRDPYTSSLEAFVTMFQSQQECFGDYWRLCKRPKRHRRTTTTTVPVTTLLPANTTTSAPNETSAGNDTAQDTDLAPTTTGEATPAAVARQAMSPQSAEDGPDAVVRHGQAMLQQEARVLEEAAATVKLERSTHVRGSSYQAQAYRSRSSASSNSLASARPSWSIEQCLEKPSNLFDIENSKCRNYMSGVRACVSAVDGVARWWALVQQAMLNSSTLPNATIFDPNATIFDPNATIFDPNATIFDPNATIFDPNATATVEPNVTTSAPKLNLTLISEWIWKTYNISVEEQEAEVAVDAECAEVLMHFVQDERTHHSPAGGEGGVSDEDRFAFCVVRVESRIHLLQRLLLGHTRNHSHGWHPCREDNHTEEGNWTLWPGGNETVDPSNETNATEVENRHFNCSNVTHYPTLAPLPLDVFLIPLDDVRDFGECVHSDFFDGVKAMAFLWRELAAPRQALPPNWPEPNDSGETSTTIAPTDVNGSTIPAPTPSPLDAAVMAWKGWRPEGEEASEEPHEEPGYAPLPIQTAMYIASVIGDAIAQMEQALAALQDVLGLMRGW